eukprot:1136666-Pelagomonas_calceolata.AAC.9
MFFVDGSDMVVGVGVDVGLEQALESCATSLLLVAESKVVMLGIGNNTHTQHACVTACRLGVSTSPASDNGGAPSPTSPGSDALSHASRRSTAEPASTSVKDGGVLLATRSRSPPRYEDVIGDRVSPADHPHYYHPQPSMRGRRQSGDAAPSLPSRQQQLHAEEEEEAEEMRSRGSCAGVPGRDNADVAIRSVWVSSADITIGSCDMTVGRQTVCVPVYVDAAVASCGGGCAVVDDLVLRCVRQEASLTADVAHERRADMNEARLRPKYDSAELHDAWCQGVPPKSWQNGMRVYHQGSGMAPEVDHATVQCRCCRCACPVCTACASGSTTASDVKRKYGRRGSSDEATGATKKWVLPALADRCACWFGCWCAALEFIVEAAQAACDDEQLEQPCMKLLSRTATGVFCALQINCKKKEGKIPRAVRLRAFRKGPKSETVGGVASQTRSKLAERGEKLSAIKKLTLEMQGEWLGASNKACDRCG